MVGRLDVPPPAEAIARLPGDFGRRYLIFVDTEEEFDWTAPRRRDAIQTTAMVALPEAHRRLAAMGAFVTYMVDYPVANNADAVDRLGAIAADGQGAIGAQLHPWVNPPQDEAMTAANSFVGNLPLDQERAKLERLTQRLRLSFGAQPIVYRAGRYGIGPNSAVLLEAAGYRMDCSVRALFDYRAEGGPDFSRHPVCPWWAGPRGSLLEVPLTAAYTGGLGARGAALFRSSRGMPPIRGALARTGLVSRVPLTPEGVGGKDVLRAIDRLLEEGVGVFSLSFHSPSLVPGHTPYVRDAADLARFWRWWDAVLDRFARAGVAAASPEQMVAAADQMRGGP